ncbi:MAG TPA: LacI family DNA-binding transcriptional regulator [Cellulomonas sp.]
MTAKVRKPSQRDIARAAGVSQAAVSMVLNGKADQYHLAAATQERVRAAIAEVGYVPDVAGRSLRGGRNGLIGVHTYESVFPVAVEDYYHEFLVGIEQAAVRRRQDLVLFASTERADGTRRIYGERGNRLRLADGAVIVGHRQSSDEVAMLADEGYPFVFIGRRQVPGAQAPYVTADYAAGTTTVVDALAAAGHRRVAYLGPDERYSPQQERHAAFLVAAGSHDLEVTAQEFADPALLTADRLRTLLDAGSTALVVETPEVGLAIDAAARELGVEVPRALSVVVLDHVAGPVAGWSHLDVPRREMGDRAVTVLLGLLDGELDVDHREVVPCGPLDLATIAPPPALPPQTLPTPLSPHPAG